MIYLKGNKMKQHTFFIIKPDGVEKDVLNDPLFKEQLSIFGLSISYQKRIKATREQLENHYHHLKDKPFFESIVDYMLSGDIIIGIIEGPYAIDKWRIILGDTDPRLAQNNSLRKRFGEVGTLPDGTLSIKNVAHGSDSLFNAEKEIGIWIND